MPSILQPGRGIGPSRCPGPRALCGQGGQSVLQVTEIHAGQRPGGGLWLTPVRSSPAPTFRSAPSFAVFTLAGVTRDSSGAALGNCDVRVFDASMNLVAQGQSDDSGNYNFVVQTNGPHFVYSFSGGAAAGATPPNVSPTSTG